MTNGTCWITNGQDNKKINKCDLDYWLSLNWTPGRIASEEQKRKCKIASNKNKEERLKKRNKTLIEKYGSTNVFQLEHVKKNYNEFLQKEQIKKDKLNFDDLSEKQKRRRILKEQNNCCLWCELKEWHGQKLTLELDHIDGNKKNNKKDNLRMLCPNCHSQTPTWRKKKIKP